MKVVAPLEYGFRTVHWEGSFLSPKGIVRPRSDNVQQLREVFENNFSTVAIQKYKFERKTPLIIP